MTRQTMGGSHRRGTHARAIASGRFFVSNSLPAGRIASLLAGTAAMGAGNLDHRIGVTGNNELSDLAGAFNEMAARLKESHTSVGNLNREIAERKEAEEALRESLEEKVALLKEVHHRVKNNLQIVASLLNLQSNRSKNREVIDMLQDTRNRVGSMALLHETLCRSANLARINFSIHVGDLCGQLLASFGPVARRVTVENRIARVGLALEYSLPCGLIVNELVSNALRHGFPRDRTGRIVVDLNWAHERLLVLSVRDDGVGLGPGLNPSNGSTLGLRLVYNLARQMKGELSVSGSAHGRGLHRDLSRPCGNGIGERLMNSRRILVVEDEAIVAMDIEDRLAGLGYQLAGWSTSGEEALALVALNRPDLVLMDIRLDGEMDGIAAAEQIRSRYQQPVIFLTAYSENATLDRDKLAEPYGYILKPFDERELRSAIEIAVHKHAADVEIRRVNRLYDMLSQVNQAVVRIRSRDELSPTICRLVAERGKVDLVWIEWVDPLTSRINPVASFGGPEEILGVAAFFAKCRVEGQGNPGKAVREGKPIFAMNVPHATSLPFRVRTRPVW